MDTLTELATRTPEAAQTAKAIIVEEHKTYEYAYHTEDDEYVDLGLEGWIADWLNVMAETVTIGGDGNVWAGGAGGCWMDDDALCEIAMALRGPGQ